MKIITIPTLAAITLTMLVAGCGQTKSDRAISGGAIGAGAGAAGTAILGGNPLAGAVIGGAVGAATGGLTKEKDVNLGKPVWR